MPGPRPHEFMESPEVRREFWKRFFLSYLGDFVCIFILFLPSILGPWITPFERPIPLDDASISYPFSHDEIFPSWSLPIVSFVVPSIIVFMFIAVERFQRPALILSIVGLLFCLALTTSITDIIKNMAGRFRPDFLARCIPYTSEDGEILCRQTRIYVLREGRRSFPSGHASSSFAGLVFASQFIMGQLRVFDGQHMFWKMGAAFLPVFLAIVVALSRVIDHRHHWQDVLVGSLIGIAVSLLVYRMQFPSVLSRNAPCIYTTRIDRIKSEVGSPEEPTPNDCAPPV